MAVDPFEKLGIDPHEEAVDPFEKMGIDPNADNIPRETSPAQEINTSQPDYNAQRIRDLSAAFMRNPLMPYMSPEMAPYYKSIGTGVGEAAQNIANFAIKNMRENPMSKAGMGAAQNNSVINQLGEQPISIFDTNKAYDPQVAKLARELAPMAIPFAGQEVAAVKLGSLIPYATSTGFKGVMEGAAKGIGRQALKAIPRAGYGAGFGGVSEMASNKEATPESVVHSMKTGAELNAVIPGIMDAVPGAIKGLANHYKNVAEETSKRGGGVLSPTQAMDLHKGLKEDVLSFPDLVKAPKLQSLYHGFLRYMPFTGIAKQEAEAVGRLESDAGKIHSEVLGNINEADDVAARESIVDGINAHANAKMEEVGQPFEEINKEKLKFNNRNTSNYVNGLSEKERQSLMTGAGGMLAPGMTTDITKILSPEGILQEEYLIKLPPGTREKIQEQIAKTKPETTIEVIRGSIGKWNDKAAAAYDRGEKNTGRIYSEISGNLQKDLSESLEKSGRPEVYKKYVDLNKKYVQEAVPFEHPEKIGFRKIRQDKIDLNKDGELENILKDYTNKDALAQLPLETQKKIFSRILNSNIGKTEEALGTRAEKMTAAYNKMSSYEKSMLDKASREKIENIASRVEQLAPVLKRTKNKFWSMFYKGRHFGYLAGMTALHAANPYMMAAAIPLSAAGRILRSPKLMETYKTGKYPETGKAKKISGLLSKAAIMRSEE
jgi:hypothetical protein